MLAGFIAKFTPEMAALIHAARLKIRKRIPRALELVYDNYNFFVIGYGPNEKAGDAIFSLAAQAKGLSLCFLQGAGLPDPGGLLRGSGNVVRNIRLESADTLDHPDVRALIEAALEKAKTQLPVDVALFIASNVRTNVRELEGALVRLIAWCSMHGVEITLSVTQQCLKQFIDTQVRKITIETIQRTVEHFTERRIGRGRHLRHADAGDAPRVGFPEPLPA